MPDASDEQIVRRDILFEQGYLEKCKEHTGDPFPGVDDNWQYCVRWQGHEDYGLAHLSVHGTTW